MESTMRKRMRNTINKQKLALMVAGNLVVGTGIPIAVGALSARSPLSVLEQWLLGIAVFAALTSAETLTVAQRVLDERQSEVGLWRIKSEADGLLAEVRADLHELAGESGPDDTFMFDHYVQQLDLMASRLHDTITNNEILIERHHVSSSHALFALYERSECNVFRATTVCGQIGEAFDVTFQVYFNEWIRQLKSRSVTSLRRLFIYDDDSELSRQSVRKFIAFHTTSIPGLEAKVIPMRYFTKFKSDYQVLDSSVDLGIFDDQYIYLGDTRSDESITGRFSRDPRLISGFTSIFDGLWGSAWARPAGAFEQRAVTLEALFDPSYQLPPKAASPGGGMRADAGPSRGAVEGKDGRGYVN